jgi:flavin reductase
MREMVHELTEGFKLALRKVAASVAVVTARRGDKFDGMTATAVTSLCADPPCLLACVARAAALNSTMAECEEFCVNYLCADQEHISRVFSDTRRRHERFQTGQWVLEPGRAPYLSDAQANIFCRCADAFPIQTHTVFVGQVCEVRHLPRIAPLLYLDGAYSSVAVRIS